MPATTLSPLGARPNTDGRTTFRVRSTVAERLELCLIDADPDRVRIRERRVEMARALDDPHVWFVSVHAPPGTRYGYRVHGPFDPDRGIRCNPAKLLLDPYARQVQQPNAITADSMVMLRDADQHGQADARDSLALSPWSVVCAERRTAPSSRPRLTAGGRVLYEAHLTHLTRGLPDVPVAARGTFSALRSPMLAEHLLELGVTTLQLLPVMHWADEPALVARGRHNVWGYNPLGFFSPAPKYCSSADIDRQWDEIAGSVAHLHGVGLELVLDVVYNHTAEGGPDGPTYHLRGLDNPTYYRLDPAQPGVYLDATGCGNTLDMAEPATADLVIDSLRHWVAMTDVDGFRFDLAPALGREPHFNPRHPLLERIGDDDLLGDRLLIAEPWDLGPGGHLTGAFTTATRGGGWHEWNDSFRDAVRDFWRPGPEGNRGRLVEGIAGSSRLFGGRHARASVGFVTAHDGFTLRDLVSYNHKHNHANGEQNADGTDNNRSYNGGVEGPTDDLQILTLRRRRQASLLATVMLQVGTPMINAGDELDRTQHGNNNPYCLDAPFLALNWEPTDGASELTALVQQLAAVRREHAELFDGRWLIADEEDGDGHIVHWLDRNGNRIDDHRWMEDPRVLAVYYPATATRGPLLIAMSSHHDAVEIRLPDHGAGDWRVGIDTARAHCPGHEVPQGGLLRLESFSVVVLAD